MSEVQLYLGDCLEFMKQLPAGSVDAAVNDTQAAIAELTDCQVVMAVAAHALQIPDIMYAAQVKAERDAERGVRNGK